MTLFGLEIRRRQKTLSSVPTVGSGGWWPLVRESFAGAWQRNVVQTQDDVLSFSTVYACVSLIASDISKLWLDLVEEDRNGIWTATESAAFSPVLRKPNHYQHRIKFVQQWILSKLLRGNTYALKARDQRGVVVRLYILDASRVTPMVADDGSVFYQLGTDNLSGQSAQGVVVPASEIIHDLMVPLFHPLVGVSPIYACGLAAQQGLRIQRHSEDFFANQAQPGGVLTAPTHIGDDTAKRLQEHWASQFSGNNVGKIAVLGDGLKYEAMTVNAKDAELIEQLKWTGETVCSCFHVPPYMVGVGPSPTYNNIEALNQQYYSQCLQILIEELEEALDFGLGLAPEKVQGKRMGVEFDLDALLRMDTATKTKAAGDGVGAGFLAPNEARKKFNLPPVEGGDTPYLQQQNYSLAALNKRDLAAPASASPAAAPEAKAIAADETDRYIESFHRAWEDDAAA